MQPFFFYMNYCMYRKTYQYQLAVKKVKGQANKKAGQVVITYPVGNTVFYGKQRFHFLCCL